MQKRRIDKDWLENRIVRIPMSGCWLWLGCIKADGHGMVSNSFGSTQIHRIAFELYKGSIPNGLNCLHSCDVPSCVNPEHLYIGTQADNIADMLTRSNIEYFHSMQNQCKNGHEYTAESTYIRPNGSRDCNICKAAAARRYRLRIRELSI